MLAGTPLAFGVSLVAARRGPNRGLAVVALVISSIELLALLAFVGLVVYTIHFGSPPATGP